MLNNEKNAKAALTADIINAPPAILPLLEAYHAGLMGRRSMKEEKK